MKLTEQQVEAKAKELMAKYPNYVTPAILEKELPGNSEKDSRKRIEVFSKMAHLAHCQNHLGL